MDGEECRKEDPPVAQKLPNPWGLYDLYGNVWEWVQDYYTDYPLYALSDPSGPAKGSKRVIQGGCYLIGDSRCNSYARGLSAGSVKKPAFGLFEGLDHIPIGVFELQGRKQTQ